MTEPSKEQMVTNSPSIETMNGKDLDDAWKEYWYYNVSLDSTERISKIVFSDAFKYGRAFGFSLSDAELKARDERIEVLKEANDILQTVRESQGSLILKQHKDILALKEKLAKAVEALEKYAEQIHCELHDTNFAKEALTLIKSDGENKGAV